MAEIAKRAGVSLSTVSYALSGKRAISDETRRRVLLAVDELGFRPHPAGRALASKRSRILALVLPAPPNGFSEVHLAFVASATDAARRCGYAMLLWSFADEAELLDLTRERLAEGAILMEVRLDDPRVALLRRHGYPFALIGHGRTNDGLDFVDLDFAKAARLAVAHLAVLGHRTVALLGTSARSVAAAYGPMVRATEGFEHAITELGLRGVVRPCEPSAREGRAAIADLLANDPAPTAVISLNQQTLGGLIQGVHDHGLGVPDEVSLVAICATADWSERASPAWTAVDVPAAEMGRIGAELLIRRLEGGAEEPSQRLLRPVLVARQTSGPCVEVASPRR